jgi:hypothetical protein
VIFVYFFVQLKLSKKLVETSVTIRFISFFFEHPFVQLFQTEGANEMLRVVLFKHGGYAPASYRFVTTGAQRPALGVIMRLAIGHTFVIVKRAADKRLVTISTHKAFSVPLDIQRRNVILLDRVRAPCAPGRKQQKVILPAIRFPILVVEPFVPERLAAMVAKEVLRVPRLIQRSDALVQYRLVAVGAPGREQLVVIRLAVRFAFAFEEILRAQLPVAVGAREMLHMPRFSQRCHNLANDGLRTRVATSFLSCCDSLSVDDMAKKIVGFNKKY